jgi:hypothetical protein
LQSLMPTAYVTYGKFIQFVVIKKCEFMLVRAGTPEGGSCLTYLFWDTRISLWSLVSGGRVVL